MRTKLFALATCLVMGIGLLTGCGSTSSGSTAQEPADTSSTTQSTAEADSADNQAATDAKIALITMDSIDQHWVTLNEGAQKAAEELGVTVDFMAPNTKDDALQIEQVNNAVAGGYDAILVAANGPDAISPPTTPLLARRPVRRCPRRSTRQA